MTRTEVLRRTKGARVLARRLGELDFTEPREIRTAVLNTLREATDCEFAVFHDVIEVEGENAVSEVVTVGRCDPNAIEGMLRAKDRAIRNLVFHRPPLSNLTGFSSPRHLFPTSAAFEASDIFRQAWEPHGTHDIAGLIVYHGQALVGVAAASWKAPRMFTDQDREILQPLAHPASAALTAAHCLERKGLPEETAYLLVRPNGRFEHASARAESWVRRRALAEAIRRRVRALDGGREPQESFALEQAEARVVRLRTRDGVRYLVCLRAVPLVQRRGAPLLTALQLRIALAAADVATAAEIAQDTGRGVETVREHLAAAYRKLNVATRLQLLHALRDPDGPAK